MMFVLTPTIKADSELATIPFLTALKLSVIKPILSRCQAVTGQTNIGEALERTLHFKSIAASSVTRRCQNMLKA